MLTIWGDYIFQNKAKTDTVQVNITFRFIFTDHINIFLQETLERLKN